NQATALQTTDDLRLWSPFAGGTDHFTRDLSALYGRSALAEAGGEALSVLKTINALPPLGTHSAYPNDDLGAGLRQTARLMKSGVGLEAACLDHNGYDTHVLQGGAQGVLAGRLASLASGLAAFADDLGPARWARTTVVVLSEFGRRVAENSGLGTDHGSGGVMLLLGGQVAGGRVHGHWPGLAAGSLAGPGDLAVTTDYRTVLAEVIALRLGNPHTAEIFPGLTQPALGVVHG
nr:DUF1501 domain-containing protein [Armatimonadota bacterium]